jgi:hypothetical protein
MIPAYISNLLRWPSPLPFSPWFLYQCCAFFCVQFHYYCLLIIKHGSLIVDFIRTGAFTSMVVVELAWFCMHLNTSNNLFLMFPVYIQRFFGCYGSPLELTLLTPTREFSPMDAVLSTVRLPQGNGIFRLIIDMNPAVFNTACHEFSAITAFGFLAWIVRKCLLNLDHLLDTQRSLGNSFWLCHTSPRILHNWAEQRSTGMDVLS